MKKEPVSSGRRRRRASRRRSSSPRATASGPLYDRIYEGYTYDEIQRAASDEIAMDSEILSKKEFEVIDLAYKRYGDNSGQALSRMSRDESPWKKARKHANVSEGEDSEEFITAKSMKKYFAKK